jgi:hypothetical protein
MAGSLLPYALVIGCFAVPCSVRAEVAYLDCSGNMTANGHYGTYHHSLILDFDNSTLGGYGSPWPMTVRDEFIVVNLRWIDAEKIEQRIHLTLNRVTGEEIHQRWSNGTTTIWSTAICVRVNRQF